MVKQQTQSYLGATMEVARGLVIQLPIEYSSFLEASLTNNSFQKTLFDNDF